MPDPYTDALQGLAAARAAVIQGHPDWATVPIGPAGWLDQILYSLRAIGSPGQVQAATNPLTGSITIDPQAWATMGPEERENLLTHELTHAQQIRQQPWGSRLWNLVAAPRFAYGQDPNELEAYQAEAQRALQLHRQIPPTPGFFGGWTDTDRYLPSDRRR